jgi:nicotinate-nucleotide pyrophosphorylase (carboxylating)
MVRDLDFSERGEVARCIDQALREDGAESDCTAALLELTGRVSARIVSRASGVMAGIEIARLTFERRDARIRFRAVAKDCDRVSPGTVVAEIHGDAGAILSAERVALNFLQSLSGVATLTAGFVEKVRGSGIRILDTRKTTPLLRSLQRYAVRTGGGENHRLNLSDMVLVKRNHIRSVGGIEALRQRLEGRPKDRLVEVEVDTLEHFRAILGWPIDRVMLDNFSPDDVRAAIAILSEFQENDAGFNPRIEISGGVDLDTIAGYMIDGVHDISIGALTHSAPALDFSLEVTRRAD